MGGQDKALVKFRGRPLIDYAVQSLSPSVVQCLISRRDNRVDLTAYGKVIEDTVGGIGPLAGVLSALMVASQFSAIVTMPCDTPLLSTGWASGLIDAWRQNTDRTYIVFDGERLHPLHMIISPNRVIDIQDYLQRGKFSVQGFAESCSAIKVDYRDFANELQNINTVEQLKAVEKQILTKTAV